MIKTESMRDFLAWGPEINKRAAETLKKEDVIAAQLKIGKKTFGFLISQVKMADRERLVSLVGQNGNVFTEGAFLILYVEKKKILFTSDILRGIVEGVEIHSGIKVRSNASFDLFPIDPEVVDKTEFEKVIRDYAAWAVGKPDQVAH